MATKYQEIYKEMLALHKPLFDRFRLIHDSYARSPALHQQEFNEVGDTILEIIQKFDQRLCGKSERTGYGSYTSKLSEKFWETIRKDFPKIDSVGLKIS